MAVRPVIRMGHPHLRRVAAPCPPEFIGTPEFKTLVADLRETLHAQGGIGLAAPQIDVDCRLAVIEIEPAGSRYGEVEPHPFRVYVNPSLRTLEPQQPAGYWEGCLSVPGLRGYVERPQRIQVDYTDGQGQPQSLQASGFLATVFQHEFDHLDGILYIDRIQDRARLAFDAEFAQFHQDATGR